MEEGVKSEVGEKRRKRRYKDRGRKERRERKGREQERKMKEFEGWMKVGRGDKEGRR